MGTLNLGGATFSAVGGNWSAAPPGTVIQLQTEVVSTDVTLTVGGTSSATLISMNFTPRLATSKLYIMLYAGQIRKHTAGTNWANLVVNNTTDNVTLVQCGAIGYPDSASDRRIVVTQHSVVNSWGTIAKTIEVRGSSSGGNGAAHTFCHQGNDTRLTIMEIV